MNFLAFFPSDLRFERNTWRLVGRLYANELMQAQTLNETEEPLTLNNSEKEIIEHAFKADQKLRRAQVIVDWLEYNAKKDLERLVPPPETNGYENTLGMLLCPPQSILWSILGLF